MKDRFYYSWDGRIYDILTDKWYRQSTLDEWTILIGTKKAEL